MPDRNLSLSSITLVYQCWADITRIYSCMGHVSSSTASSTTFKQILKILELKRKDDDSKNAWHVSGKKKTYPLVN